MQSVLPPRWWLPARRADGVGRLTNLSIHATIRGEPTGAMRLLQPLVRPLVRRNVERDYRRLKELLEGEAGGAAGRGGSGPP